MDIKSKIHWHEGLFLQPHHLQVFQKGISDGFKHTNLNMFSYPSGIIESEISPGKLSLGKLKYEKLKVVMKNGLYIDTNENTELPELDLKEFLKSKENSAYIKLGIPKWKNTKSNTSSISSRNKPHKKSTENKTSKTYKLFENNFNDENTGDNQKAILLKKFNGRLFLNHDTNDTEEQTKDYDLISIDKLTKSPEDEKNLLKDKSYIPPCLVINGSNILKNKLDQFLGTINLKTKEHIEKLAESPAFYSESGKAVRPILKLLLLSKHSARLGQLLKMANLTPCQVYLELVTMYGEFYGLSADQNLFKCPEYNHNNLSTTFDALIDLLKEKLKFFYKINPYIRSPFNLSEKNDMLTLKLTDEQIKNGAEYILAVSANMSPRDIINIVENGTGFKIMSPGTARGKAVPGLQLTGYFDKNFQLPQTPGTCYFQIAFSEENPLWKNVLKEKEIAIVCKKPGLDKLNVELFIMLKEETTSASIQK